MPTVENAISQAVADGRYLKLAGGTMTGNIAMSGAQTVDGRDVSADGTKLDELYTTIGLSALTSAEVDQLEAIGTTTISATQWAYLGALDQGLTQASSPTFAGLTLAGNLLMGGNGIGNNASVLTFATGSDGQVGFTGDITVDKSFDGLLRLADFYNSSSHADAGAYISIGTAGQFDSLIIFNVDNLGQWALGIDSSDSDKFKLHNSGAFAEPSRFELTTAGALTLAAGLTLGGALAMGTNAISGATSVTATSFVIGGNSLDTNEWANLDGQDQAVKTTDSPTFGGLSLTGNLALAANSVTGTSVDINNAELQQLSNIGATTISAGQWAYLGAMNQGVGTGDNVQFARVYVADDGVVGAEKSGAPFGWTFDATPSTPQVELTSGAVMIGDAQKIYFEASGTTQGGEYITSGAADYLDIHFTDDDKGCRFYSGANLLATLSRYSAGSPTVAKLNTPGGIYFYSGATILMNASPASTRFRAGYVSMYGDTLKLVFGALASGDSGVWWDSANHIIDPDHGSEGTGKVYIGATADDDLWAGGLRVGGAAHYMDVAASGLTYWVGTGGIPFADMYVNGNAVETAIAGAGTYVQITVFTTNGEALDAVPDHTNDHITITKAGRYKVSWWVSVESIGAGAADHVSFEVRKNNGATAFANTEGRRKLAGGGGDTGSVSGGGYIDLAANDTVELWGTNEDNATNFLVTNVTLAVGMKAGT